MWSFMLCPGMGSEGLPEGNNFLSIVFFQLQIDTILPEEVSGTLADSSLPLRI